MAMPRLALLVLTATTVLGQDPGTGERKLATIPKDLQLSETSTGPDSRQVVTHTRFAFGAGGKFVAYAAHRGNKSVAMAGNVELGEFDYLHDPVMDANATHYAFRAGNRTSETKEKWWAIKDGKKGKAYAWIGEVAVSANAEVAFWEQPGAKIQRDGTYNNSSMVLHVGKRKGKKFDQSMAFNPPYFSADGKTVISAALRERQWFAVTATSRKEKVGKRGYPMIEDAALSHDGKRTAVVVVEGGMPLPPGMPAPPGAQAGKWRLVVDGKHYGDDTDGAGAPIFAPKGKRFVFKFLTGAKMGLALDNQKSPKAEYDFVATPVFDSSGQTIAYTANSGGTIEPFARLHAWGDAMVKGGTWSLYLKKGKGKPKAIVEGVEGIAHPTFGPKGQLAYAQKFRGRWYMMVEGRRSEAFDDLGPPYWSPDGGRVEFGARRERELWWKVLELQ